MVDRSERQLREGWQIGAIDEASKRISDLARQCDLGQPVGHLGRWKVRDVVAHLGGIHRWTTRIVSEQSMAGPSFTKSKLDGTELCDWFDEGATLLLNLFRSRDLEGPCPNFNPGSESTVSWWARRQAHETTVHRWDVEKSLGEVSEIASLIAADGVDEFLDVFVRTRGKQTLTSTLVLGIQRPVRTWTLSPAKKPGRIDVANGRPGQVPATDVTEVAGNAEGLLLALWGRRSATEAELTIDGELAAAESLMTI